MEKLPKTLKDLAVVIRFLFGSTFLGVGLYIFLFRGEEPSIFFWALGGALMGIEVILDKIKK